MQTQVNYMCYFDPTPDNDVGKWNDSINMLFEQNYPKSTINIAIPYCKHMREAVAWK